eukprot:4753891-Amphidinium_carterae.2
MALWLSGAVRWPWQKPCTTHHVRELQPGRPLRSVLGRLSGVALQMRHAVALKVGAIGCGAQFVEWLRRHGKSVVSPEGHRMGGGGYMPLDRETGLAEAAEQFEPPVALLEALALKPVASAVGGRGGQSKKSRRRHCREVERT